MFTGIIETLGTVVHIESEGNNSRFTIASAISNELKVDQSISHNGVCLTVEAVDNDTHQVVAVKETLQRAMLGSMQPGDIVNLERCMLNNGRFDGHIVQGHVDQIATVRKITEEGGSWLFEFEYDTSHGNITVEKGSIAVNGVSLTCFNTKEDAFTVAIIPYTYKNTNFNRLSPGDRVNLEFDIIGKYVKGLINVPRSGG